ncbi:MAG: type II toxin-antitoxin system PemK/MazF family toxin [Desulfobulbaceae bacterium]|nr:type II toxin-antitoxin system PemK/MazF family toxin [Desulfobulbaceae bacterium]
MMFEAGSIVLIPFPFSDLKSSKKRPVLMLTVPDSNGDFIALAVTSKGYHPGAVELTAERMQSGTLPCQSWIRTEKVFTLTQSLIMKIAGKVKGEIVEQAITGLCDSLGDKQ